MRGGWQRAMTRIVVVQGDITRAPVDVIVNAANSELRGGGGVDGAIHAAGGPEIMEECQAWIAEHGRLPTGQAMKTSAGTMDAQAVVHTVGPIWGDHTPEEADKLLSDCYRNSMLIAHEAGHRSIAFPNISTGVYGFPKDRAAEIAVETVRATITETPMDEVRFVCFDEENMSLYETRFRGGTAD